MERIDSIDLIRGIAILGILLMNVMAMAAPEIAYYVPEWFEGAGFGEHLVYGIQSLFVESRFMGLFSLLFGVGLAIQSDRFVARGLSPRRWIRRRLGWLLLFGLLHGLLFWAGDILTVYAVCGFLVLFLMDRPVKRLVRTGVILVLLGQLALLAAFFGSLLSGENIMEIPSLPYSPAEIDALRELWTRSPARFSLNAATYLELLSAIPLTFIWHTSGVMLIGVALYRSGFFSDGRARRWALPLAGGGLVAGALVLLLRYRIGVDTSAGYATLGMMMIPGLAMAIGYASLLVPLGGSTGLVARALRNTGKTAFTLYLAQTVVTVAIFALLAPGLWGRLGRGELWGYVLLFSIVQVVFAHRWQTRRGQGPMESLWRRLAFRRLPTS